MPGHFLLDSLAGWRADTLDGVVQDADCGELRLVQLPGSGSPLIDSAGSLGGMIAPRGVAVDREDRVYILDAGACLIKRFDPCESAFTTLPCIGGCGRGPRELDEPHGLAISCNDDLYVADGGNRRVLVFALKGLPLRAIWGPLKVSVDAAGVHVESTAPLDVYGPGCAAGWEFQAGTWRPSDVALSSRGWAYVADYDNDLIHAFDAFGCWRRAFTGEGPGVPAFVHPTRIAVDREDRLYVIQEGVSYVVVLDRDGTFKRKIESPAELHGDFCPVAVGFDAKGNLHLCESTSGRLLRYCPADDGSYTYQGCCEAAGAIGVSFDQYGNVLLVDSGAAQVVCLQSNCAFAPRGRYWSQPLDSGIYRCEWHRVALCARLCMGTQVRVDTFTSESSKSPGEILGLAEERWATAQINSLPGENLWDCLILSPPGRYLWLRLTLVGNGADSPRIDWAEVYYPRASSLRYLPAVFSEDPTSRDFLGRFLSIFDSIQDGIAQQIGGIARFFDPAAAPTVDSGQQGKDFLAWLASWMGLALDRHWPSGKRRALLANAYRLYRMRGTPEALRLHLRIYTGVEPRILEHFKLRRWLFLGAGRLGDSSQVWGDNVVKRLQLDVHDQVGTFQLIDTGDPLRDPFYQYAHRFSVFLPLKFEVSATEQQTLQRIVEMAKPAYSEGTLRLVEPRFRIGVQAFIGLDTMISAYPGRAIEGEGRLGYDAVLGASADETGPPTMRVGVRSRIGSSTLVD
jgi:phage tail-like protein